MRRIRFMAHEEDAHEMRWAECAPGWCARPHARRGCTAAVSVAGNACGDATPWEIPIAPDTDAHSSMRPSRSANLYSCCTPGACGYVFRLGFKECWGRHHGTTQRCQQSQGLCCGSLVSAFNLLAISSQLMSSFLLPRGLIDKSSRYSGNVHGCKVKYTVGDEGGDGTAKNDNIRTRLWGAVRGVRTSAIFGVIGLNGDIFQFSDYLQSGLPDLRDEFSQG